MTPEQAPCECKKREEKVQAHGYCPTYQMASVPVLTAETIVDFDPENTCVKYVNTLVVDPKNGRTFFYDVFGIMTEIKTDKQAKDLIKKLKDEKQNAIKNHNPEIDYRENDIVVFDGKLYQALQDIKGEFNSANWRVLDGTTGALPQYETITEPKTTYAPNKLLITPTGDVSFSGVDGEVKPIKQKEEIAKTKTNIETNRYKELISVNGIADGKNTLEGVVSLESEGTVATVYAKLSLTVSSNDFAIDNNSQLVELAGTVPADFQFFVYREGTKISLVVSSRNQHEVKSSITNIHTDLTVLKPKKEAQALESGIKKPVALTIE
jgi:hypothetical protein